MRDIDNQLLNAVIAGDIPAVEQAIADGADVNCVDDSGRSLDWHVKENGTVLANLIRNEHTLDALKAALGGKQTIGTADTQLFEAAKNGDSTALKAALEAGANVNCVDSDGKTPLKIAINDENENLALNLIIAGAKAYETMPVSYIVVKSALSGNDLDTSKTVFSAMRRQQFPNAYQFDFDGFISFNPNFREIGEGIKVEPIEKRFTKALESGNESSINSIMEEDPDILSRLMSATKNNRDFNAARLLNKTMGYNVQVEITPNREEEIFDVKFKNTPFSLPPVITAAILIVPILACTALQKMGILKPKSAEVKINVGKEMLAEVRTMQPQEHVADRAR